MNKTLKLFIQAFIISLPLYASNLVIFEPNAPIKAIDVNTNFDYIKSILQSRNIPMSFKSFQSGNVIQVDEFEEEFDKLRSLNISVDPLNLLQIKSSEINQAFAQMKNGSLIVDDIPSSFNFNFSVDEDSQYLGTVIYNNQTGDSVLEIVSPPSKGTIVVGLNGNFSFTPNLNQNGSDSFTFRINDGSNLSNVSTASIKINPVNDAPIVSAQSLAVTDEGSLNIIFSGTDVEGSSLTYEVVDNPGKAVLSGSGNSRTYKPNINASGADTFTFRAFDGESYSSPATISIAITAVWPTGGTALNIASGNQTISAGSVYNYSSINIASGATLTIQGSNAFTVIGSSGPIVINGSIIVDNTGNGATSSTSVTTPNGLELSSEQIRVAGGGGGRGGGGHPTNYSLTPGGSSIGGRGGGGAGGRGTGNSGPSGNAPAVPSGTADSTQTHGGNGGHGNSGGGAGAIGAGGGQAGTRHTTGASAAGGGGGGGGGYFGDHGLPVYIKSKTSISGSGIINVAGKNGFNGGNGGNGGYLNGSEISERNCRATGGGGGGGSGGAGGDLWLHAPSVSINSSVAGGDGGIGGLAGGNAYYETAPYVYCGKNGINGLPGDSGEVTTIIMP